MSINRQVVDPSQYKAYETLLGKAVHATIFHTTSWAATLISSYNYKPCYFILLENKTVVCIVAIMEINSWLTGCRGVALPFSDNAGPILLEIINRDIVLNHIIDFGKERGWRSIEFRGWEEFLYDKPCSDFFYHHMLPLSGDINFLYSQLHKTAKRKIKRAAKSGIKIKIDYSLTALKAYYDLHCMTRKRQGVPPQPFSFFQNVYHHIISKDKGAIILASLDNAYIAGSIYFHFKKKAYYKYGAFDTKYDYLSPSYFVMWEAIKIYAQNGYESLCFGRTEPENKGLLQYKASWGCSSKIIKYYKYNINMKIFIDKKNRSKYNYKGFFTILPSFVLRILGSVLYKHIG